MAAGLNLADAAVNHKAASITGAYLHKILRSAVFAAALIGTTAQAGPACFTKPEMEAAHLRALLQQFNVAALNCQTTDPNDPTFASHYNKFVLRFGTQLSKNSEVLKHHFASDHTGLDRWITRLANDAGSQVINKPDFCQLAWDRLGDMVALEPADMQLYANRTEAATAFAPACAEIETAHASGSGQKKTPSK